MRYFTFTCPVQRMAIIIYCLATVKQFVELKNRGFQANTCIHVVSSSLAN